MPLESFAASTAPTCAACCSRRTSPGAFRFAIDDVRFR